MEYQKKGSQGSGTGAPQKDTRMVIQGYTLDMELKSKPLGPSGGGTKKSLKATSKKSSQTQNYHLQHSQYGKESEISDFGDSHHNHYAYENPSRNDPSTYGNSEFPYDSESQRSHPKGGKQGKEEHQAMSSKNHKYEKESNQHSSHKGSHGMNKYMEAGEHHGEKLYEDHQELGAQFHKMGGDQFKGGQHQMMYPQSGGHYAGMPYYKDEKSSTGNKKSKQQPHEQGQYADGRYGQPHHGKKERGDPSNYSMNPGTNYYGNYNYMGVDYAAPNSQMGSQRSGKLNMQQSYHPEHRADIMGRFGLLCRLGHWERKDQ